MSLKEGDIVAERYIVKQFLGRGGMAEVYKVYDQKLATYLAMKVLREDLAEDEVFVQRFKREARTLARLQHPYIVRFYGYEQYGTLACILMDYIEGGTLRSEIAERRSPFPPERILQIMRPLCSALQYAHNMGKVHCDLKPGNIMIKQNGDVLLTDLGIARETDAVTTATMVGFGAPAYMAPEQILGRDPTPQTDIYALGIVLYEMLTGGKRPFTGDQAQTTGSTGEKVRWEQLKLGPPSPRKYNKAISPEVEVVVMKCLEKEPGKRYPDALVLLNALERAYGGVEKAQPEGKKESQPQPKRVEKRGKSAGRTVKVPLWLFGALGAIVLVIVIAWSGWKALSGAVQSGRLLSLFDPIPTSAGTHIPQPTYNATATPLPVELTDEKGVVMRLVPAGEFIMGSENGDSDEMPIGNVYLSDYYLDTYEVTNGAYRECAIDGSCQVPEERGSYTRDSYYGNPYYADYPVINVSWYDAREYCEWRGGRLPTEAEWEKAARGTNGKIFPWGNNSANCRLANFYYQGGYCEGDTVAVGNYGAGASPYGVMDMAGNVWEWVSSQYEPYPYDAQDGREDLDASGERVLRGGSWGNNGGNIHASYRYRDVPFVTYYNIGFRCAKSP